MPQRLFRPIKLNRHQTWPTCSQSVSGTRQCLPPSQLPTHNPGRLLFQVPAEQPSASSQPDRGVQSQWLCSSSDDKQAEIHVMERMTMYRQASKHVRAAAHPTTLRHAACCMSLHATCMGFNNTPTTAATVTEAAGLCKLTASPPCCVLMAASTPYMPCQQAATGQPPECNTSCSHPHVGQRIFHLEA